MKKLLVLAMAALLVSFSVPAMAEGDFELSGHINTGFGFQYNGKAPVGALGGAFVEEGMLNPDFSRFNGNLTNKAKWIMYVGDVELDIAKSFGENIRLRTDLDFARANSMSFGEAIWNQIEQAYVTINIPVGYGIEFLIGRFNAPMGFEAVDNNDNYLPFHTLIFNFLRPQNLTGLKFYYPFSDMIDLHIWVANNLRDVNKDLGFANLAQGDSSIPAFGTRIGFTWGAEGQENTIGLSGTGSPEMQVNGKKWGRWSYLGDIDFNVWVNDVFAIGGEGLFRRDGAIGGTRSNFYLAGILDLHYVFSDVWDGTLRYNYSMDRTGSNNLASYMGANAPIPGLGAATLNGAPGASQFHVYALNSALGWKMQVHQIDLGFNYHITDGAKLMAMYRFEYMRPDSLGMARNNANCNSNAWTSTLAANFAYEF